MYAYANCMYISIHTDEVQYSWCSLVLLFLSGISRRPKKCQHTEGLAKRWGDWVYFYRFEAAKVSTHVNMSTQGNTHCLAHFKTTRTRRKYQLINLEKKLDGHWPANQWLKSPGRGIFGSSRPGPGEFWDRVGPAWPGGIFGPSWPGPGEFWHRVGPARENFELKSARPEENFFKSRIIV